MSNLGAEHAKHSVILPNGQLNAKPCPNVSVVILSCQMLVSLEFTDATEMSPDIVHGQCIPSFV